MSIFAGLNKAQQEAAAHIDGAMLILAGAGSGKTKTITTRLAYLIDEVGIPATNTLTLTFTNKAASVMRTRALNLLTHNAGQNPLLCTFHKFGLMFLRLYIERLGRKNDFVVIDTDDAKKILKNLLNDDEKLSVSTILNHISAYKNELASVEDAFKELDFIQGFEREKYQKIARYYKAYQEMLLRLNFVDFDDLLLLSYNILNADENFAKEQSAKYHYIMVDEYQDTNELQFQILQKLCTTHENIAVVGDDDQSIYAWRGAKIENILNFQKQFHNVKLVKLEQNYRSTSLILDAANSLIEHNKKRLGKTLISTKETGQDIELLQSYDEKDESQKVCVAIKGLLKEGIKPSEIAILYRVNALSRALEEALMKAQLPFKILSGMRFYERAEIKDIIAYLRFLLNHNDDFSLKRIINKPKRAFGETSFKKLQSKAKELNLPLFETLCALQGTKFFSAKLDKEMATFTNAIMQLSQIDDLRLLLDEFEKLIKLKDFYKDSTDGDERVRNIDEFYANVKERADKGEIASINELLNEISLQSEQDEVEGECVYLMSIHASKGLEFDAVFIVGLEDGFFPILSEDGDIEEERRLAYVAITRAKKRLFLSTTNSRFYRGSRSYNLETSKFLGETGVLDENELEVIFEPEAMKRIKDENLSKKLGAQGLKTSLAKGANEPFKKGDLVKHKIFGIGRVVGAHKGKVGVNFGGIERTIMAEFLEKVM